ncbi:MAG: hypothetical protein JNK12_15315 [Acidimicrobiales bacterium]|nr:hypothetical protein [Acidimicrobiales bacterium]
MTDSITVPDALSRRGVDHHLLHEAATMALYVAIVVEAALLTLWVNQDPGERSDVHGVHLIALIWGTTIGLTLAHLFAFRLAGRAFVYEGANSHGRVAAAQLAGAAAVALLCSIPGLFASDTNDLPFSLFVPEIIIGVAGYVTARTSGSSKLWALAIGIGAATLGLLIAVAKNVLAGH